MNHTLSYISSQAFTDETALVNRLCRSLSMSKEQAHSTEARARLLAEYARAHSQKGGIEHFLHEYRLDTKEGVALMCLAEALLRIPDTDTAHHLISDKLDDVDWEKRLGLSESLFINASNWGLMLTGGVVEFGRQKDESPLSLLRSLVKRCGEPLIREALKSAMRIIGTQFVMGETIEEAIERSHDKEYKKYRFSFDMLGEGARSKKQAEDYFTAYSQAIDTIAASADKQKPWQENPGISIKLSGLHPRYQLTQKKRVMEELLPRLLHLVLQAAEAGISVAIDAEESTRLDLELELFSALFSHKSLSGYEGLGFVLQAYQKRAYDCVDFLTDISSTCRKSMPIRLVKGAYWDAEIKWAQAAGLPGYTVFTRKEHTDVSYLACAKKILSNAKCFYPQFATHNAFTAASIIEMAGGQPFEFQRLHGMGDALYEKIVQTHPCRVYAPVGRQENLLAYLIRRLLENGANTSFVHQLMDKEISLDEMLADPVKKTLSHHQALPNPNIPLPEHLYRGDRANSLGVDMGNVHAVGMLMDAVTPHFSKASEPVSLPSYNYDAMFAAGQKAQAGWDAQGAEARADLLERIADSINKHAPELVALLMTEAKKTIADAVGEVREAQDFLRYYAARAREMFCVTTLKGVTGENNKLHVSGRGVFVAISPWNFPLAIFTGQIAAALAAGNAVIAKPAEQTPRIARAVVALMHKEGLPQHVLQLALGDGGVGAALTAHPLAAGVVFTGSTDTAKNINQLLAAKSGPIVPFIAETGGQNCMIVDSSALIEQVIDDIIASTFMSAGQRCSALRVLYVQKEIADELLAVLSGAMQELKLGDTKDIATDIGPVIDSEARKTLETHIERMSKEAKLIAKTPPADKFEGDFVSPHAFEITSITQLTGEVFGPILHVLRFDMNAIDSIIADINATGYGLTFGIHSRISDRVEYITSRINAGNIYINRSMIGAVVGVQPFGGEGLSGTGPKAGGPYYLHRFVKERVVSTNTAAIGGNLELLS